MDVITKKLIIQLKKVRSEKKLTPQEIVDMCLENGDYVSLSTVKRIFSADSENMGFRYDTSIRPIAKALLGLGDDPDAASQLADDSESETNALRALVEVKNLELAEKDNIIAVKDHMIEGLESGIKDREQQTAKIREEYISRMEEKDRKASYLKAQVEEKASEVAQLKKTSKVQTVVIVVLVLALMAFLTFTHWQN